MTEPIYRRLAQDGDEQDAFSRVARRDGPKVLGKAGIVHATKTRAARRYRRTTRQALRTAGHWGGEMIHAAGRADVDSIIRYYDLASV